MPEAQLLVSDQCPHCHTLEKLLQQRRTTGTLDSLTVTNVDEALDLVRAYGIRSVPWLKLDDFIFDSALTSAELDDWIALCESGSGQSEYIAWLLSNGKLPQAIHLLEQEQASLSDTMPLLANPEAKMNVRIGIGAILEHFENTDKIKTITPQLIELLNHENHAIRTDACHYLSLTHSQQAIEPLTKMLLDEHPEVREVAQESISYLVS